ncbi:MAG: glycerol-3-phosphate 1-O-acyltransferase PlsY [Thermodesulfobacteriota bacterium]
MLPAVTIIIICYLLGSVPTGALLSRKLAGVDVTSLGSGNIGAANVLRVAGKKLGVLTLIGDMAKGVISVLLVRLFLGDQPVYLAQGALAAFLGHLYPIYLKFRGGKGVAVGLGAFLALAPLVGVVVFLIWAAVVALSKRVSLGSLVAALSLPAMVWVFKEGLPYLILAGGITVLIFYRHRDNIRRLISGTEPGFRLSS